MRTRTLWRYCARWSKFALIAIRVNDGKAGPRTAIHAKIFLVLELHWSEGGRISSAQPRRAPPARRFGQRGRDADEIHLGEWPDPEPAIVLWLVLRANRRRLFAGRHDGARLLRSSMLRRASQRCRYGARAAGALRARPIRLCSQRLLLGRPRVVIHLTVPAIRSRNKRNCGVTGPADVKPQTRRRHRPRRGACARRPRARRHC
jgi:hypothetical protein